LARISWNLWRSRLCFQDILIFLEIFNYRQSCIQTASRRLHASGDSHEISFLSSWTIWLLL
jgi:hypothetical protein